MSTGGVNLENIKDWIKAGVVGTVGAGDGFAAGFLSGILKNLSIKECV